MPNHPRLRPATRPHRRRLLLSCTLLCVLAWCGVTLSQAQSATQSATACQPHASKACETTTAKPANAKGHSAHRAGSHRRVTPQEDDTLFIAKAPAASGQTVRSKGKKKK